MMADRIKKGLEQFDIMEYQDLPTYAAIRNSIKDDEGFGADRQGKRALVLCSYTKTYQKQNWKRLSTYFPKADPEGGDIEMVRVSDIVTSRLVSHTIYQALRDAGICLVDWTNWGANLFFELGIRMACSDSGTINIIEDRCGLLEWQRNNPDKEPGEFLKASGIEGLIDIQADEFDEEMKERFENIQCQCVELLKFFKPILYKTDRNRDYYENMWKAYWAEQHIDKAASASPAAGSKDLATHYTYRYLNDAIDWRTEPVSVPVYRELLESVRKMRDNEDAGRSALLYKNNDNLKRSVNEGIRGRLLAAWYYLENEYGRDLDAIRDAEEATLIDDYKEICISLAELAGLPGSSEEDKRVAEEALNLLGKLEEIGS